MKTHTKILVSLLITSVFAPGFVFAQVTKYSTHWQLETPHTQTHDYTARDYIQLLPGFEYKAEDDPASPIDYSFTGRILEGYVGNVVYESPAFPEVGSPPNPLLPVGATPISIDVTPSGASTGRIPIEVPPGSGGMTPMIAVTYNSQGGLGMMGMGWNLSAASTISRTGKNNYYDGISGGVNMNTEDRFTLDGNRLILVTGTYGGVNSIYYTEQNNFSEVKALGTAGTGPASFTVRTKDGKTLIYGGTSDSKKMLGSKPEVMTWCISQITDESGNTVNFQYGVNTAGQYYLDQITYAGNTVKFYYENDTETINTYYIAGLPIRQNLLLTKIRTLVGSDVAKEYYFHYTHNFYAHLSEIIEYGYDGSQLNSTFIKWFNMAEDHKTLSGFSFAKDARYVFGDFNGDAKTDVVSFTSGVNWTYYINNGTTFIPQSTELTPGTDFSIVGDSQLVRNINSYDLNGDGKDDLIFKKPLTGTAGCIDCDPGETHSFEYIPYLSTGTGFTPAPGTSIIASISSSMLPGDYDADGLMDIMLFKLAYGKWKIFFYKGGVKTSQGGTFTPPAAGLVSSYKIEAGSFNSNGRQDVILMLYRQATLITRAYEYDPLANSLILTAAPGYGIINVPTYVSHMLGDYNGDGKADMLMKQPGTNDKWDLYYNTGTGFAPTVPTFHLGEWDNTAQRKNNLMTADLNGDGRSDVVRSARFTGELTPFYSKGEGFTPGLTIPAHSRTPLLDQFFFGDFNGDAQSDLLLVAAGTNAAVRYHFFPNDKRHLVRAVRNGLGATVSLNYRCIGATEVSQVSEPDLTLGRLLNTDTTQVYTKGSGGAFPIVDFAGPLYVVESMTGEDGIGGNTSTSYRYGGGKLHLGGKGFLGFTQYTVLNTTQEFKSVNTYSLDVKLNLVPLSSVTYAYTPVLSEPIVSKTYENSLHTVGSFISFPYVSKEIRTDHLRSITTTSEYGYDGYGNLTAQSVDYDGDATSAMSASYTAAGNAWVPNKPDVVTHTMTRTGLPAYSRSTDYDYGSNGKASTIESDPGAAKSVTHTYSYDGYGNVSNDTWSATGLTSRSMSYGYDGLGRFMTSQSNGLGHSESMTRDARNGNVLTSTDANDHTNTYQYDGFGRLKQCTTYTGAISTYQYTWAVPGLAPPLAVYTIAATAQGRPPVTEQHDLLGRIIRIETVGFNGTPILKDQVYNHKGQLASETKPYGAGEPIQPIVYAYDNKGRTVSQTLPETQIAYLYDGRKTTTINAGAVQQFSQTIDATGQVIEAVDAGGTIAYDYYSSGLPKKVTPPDGEIVEMEYDAYGRQSKLTDPNAGVTIYEYNAFGELESQTDAKSQAYTFTYDAIGRPAGQTGPEGTYSRTYDTKTNGIGLPATETAPSGHQVDYAYNAESWLDQVTEDPVGSGPVFTTSYGYDSFGNVTGHTYPTGFTIENTYNTYGFLTQVKEQNGLVPIWTGVQQNSRGQWTDYLYGNGQAVKRTYDQHGFPLSYASNTTSPTGGTALLNLKYKFDAPTGNLLMRSDENNALTETFTYDRLDRLQSIQSPGGPMLMEYGTTGNILSKTLTGNYTYGGSPHAVTDITNPIAPPAYPAIQQELTYTPFNKVESITEGDSVMEFSYGPDQERRITELYEGGTLIKKRYYSIAYEQTETSGNVRRVHYIPAGDGLAAIYVTNNGAAGTIYYVHKDHLGSILLLNDNLGVPKEAYSYDAWGKRRDPRTWTSINLLPVTDPLTDRGYTGHEHLDGFGLINMNGRMYDPIAGRMLSADIYANAGSSQGLNRYSYVMNNPLKYTDPSGWDKEPIDGGIVPDGETSESWIDQGNMLAGGKAGGAGFNAMAGWDNFNVEQWGFGLFDAYMAAQEAGVSAGNNGEEPNVAWSFAGVMAGGLAAANAPELQKQGSTYGYYAEGNYLGRTGSGDAVWQNSANGNRTTTSPDVMALGMWTPINFVANQGGASNSGTDSRYADVGAGFGIAAGMVETASNQVRREIIQETRNLGRVTAANRSAWNSFSNVSRYTGYAGKALGFYGVWDAGKNFINDPTNPANWVKLGANTGMLFMKANPATFVIGVGYTVLDQGGYIDKWIGTKP